VLSQLFREFLSVSLTTGMSFGTWIGNCSYASEKKQNMLNTILLILAMLVKHVLFFKSIDFFEKI